MVTGIERVMPILRFSLRDAEVRLTAERQDAPPRLIRIAYEIIVDTDEADRRLALLHENVRKYGTISNILAAALPLGGMLHRATARASPSAANGSADGGSGMAPMLYLRISAYALKHFALTEPTRLAALRLLRDGASSASAS
jgi:hypothetical protein